ncbi:hypothetical protein PAEPH01_2477 [Pancytospora epiphaga]|nr:hypothetical protein PAEPH01_2477 [Pancytospora epiphaga]
MLLDLTEVEERISENSRIYSIAMVKEWESENLWNIQYKDTKLVIKTSEKLVVSSWIRFCGILRAGVIICDFVEVLNGIDMEVLLKCLRKLSKAS